MSIDYEQGPLMEGKVCYEHQTYLPCYHPNHDTPVGVDSPSVKAERVDQRLTEIERQLDALRTALIMVCEEVERPRTAQALRETLNGE